jgi:hypothetical protein
MQRDPVAPAPLPALCASLRLPVSTAPARTSLCCGRLRAARERPRSRVRVGFGRAGLILLIPTSRDWAIIGITAVLHAALEDAQCATLTIGTRTYKASARVVRAAERMFKISPERRAHRLTQAKTALARASGAKGITEICRRQKRRWRSFSARG